VAEERKKVQPFQRFHVVRLTREKLIRVGAAAALSKTIPEARASAHKKNDSKRSLQEREVLDAEMDIARR
jgi:hypothetical protein